MKNGQADMDGNVVPGGGGTHADADTVRAELAALREGAGFRLMPEQMAVKVIGDDRVEFLHGMCSNDVKSLKPGRIAYALVLTEHAHLIADMFIWAMADYLLLEVNRALWPAARAQFEKFLVADDVEFEECGDLSVLDIEGPRSGEIASALLSAQTPAPYTFGESGNSAWIANLPRWGGPAVTVIAQSDRMTRLPEEIGRVYSFARPVSAQAVEVLRVEQGVARVGVDTTERTLAPEARLENGISYKKGCYVGQETIERAAARGGVKKRLYGLRLQGDGSTGVAVKMAGKEVGIATSLVDSPRWGRIGLAILHHSAWQAGTEVSLSGQRGEVRAEVCDLPFG